MMLQGDNRLWMEKEPERAVTGKPNDEENRDNMERCLTFLLKREESKPFKSS